MTQEILDDCQLLGLRKVNLRNKRKLKQYLDETRCKNYSDCLSDYFYKGYLPLYMLYMKIC